MMSNEEFDKRMDFFLNQQAQFDADIQQMKEVQKGHQETIGQILHGLKETKELANRTDGKLAELATLTTEGFKVVAERFNAITENSKNTDAKIAALVDSQIRTDEIVKNIGKKTRSPLERRSQRHLRKGLIKIFNHAVSVDS